ncbi:MAG: DUF309 domain-containing protein [Thermodesulfobacteriota bacterium]
MPYSSFDPFGDRLARDLRNQLSQALAAALASGQPDPVLAVAAGFRPRLAAVHLDYLDRRLAGYTTVLGRGPVTDDSGWWQALAALWEQGLFFEVHELIEGRWRRARGQERAALHGLILAAGALVHREAGHDAAAVKMAGRARALLPRTSDLSPSPALPGLLAAVQQALTAAFPP